jgi:hypothetical protein
MNEYEYEVQDMRENGGFWRQGKKMKKEKD